MLKGSKKKASSKAASKSKAESKKGSNSLDDYEEIVEGEMPSDNQLRQWVRAYVRCFNTSKKTLKDAMVSKMWFLLFWLFKRNLKL